MTPAEGKVAGPDRVTNTVTDTGLTTRPPSAVELGRRAYRRTQTARSVLLSAVSTLLFAIVIWVFVVNTPGWTRVQQSFFDPAVAVKACPRVFEGLLLNIRVLLVAAVGVLIVSLLLATLRTLRGATTGRSGSPAGTSATHARTGTPCAPGSAWCSSSSTSSRT
ncbi:hypothetical protein RCH22_002473 [Cryobacterium psychrotolerans]|nr:hypothetical protein [Cryobacterium psychrotolerans]